MFCQNDIIDICDFTQVWLPVLVGDMDNQLKKACIQSVKQVALPEATWVTEHGNMAGHIGQVNDTVYQMFEVVCRNDEYAFCGK